VSQLRYASVPAGRAFAFSDAGRKRIEDLLARYPTKQAALLPVLWLAQEELGWISREAVEVVAGVLGLSPAYVDGVLTFYTMYHLKPVGKFHLQFCTSISCHLNGGEDVLEHCRRKLGVAGDETSPDGLFSIEEVECIAGCDRAPSMQVNDQYREPMTPEKLDAMLAELSRGGDRGV
jgi:NADH-quinone oxidoreductase subunit E